jgi:hypothetical protein
MQALRDLAAAPEQIDTIRAWLRPEHFACPEHGDLYAVIRDLRTAGKPADPVTIGWEAARRGITPDPADLTGGNGPLADASARDLHRLALLARATHTGRYLRDSAADPTCPPRALLRSAADRLGQLERDAGPAAKHTPGRDAQVITMLRHEPPTSGRAAQAGRQEREAAP